MKRRKFSRRRPWSAVCPDGHRRAFPQLTKEAAAEVALEKSLVGCQPFPDDPRRWWKRQCPQGRHRAVKASRAPGA